MSRLAAAVLLVTLVTGCSIGLHGSKTASTTTAPPTTATTSPPSTMTLTVFRVENGRLSAQAQAVPQTTAPASAALKALGLDASVTIANGTATVVLPAATPDQVAEVVYTLTQFPTVQRVAVAGHPALTRSDEAAYAPVIFIQSPAAGARVPATFHVIGSATVFEATLVVELVMNGSVVRKNTVTASAGAPERGSFDTTLQAPSSGPATVVAYAPSAADGSPQHRVEVPVTVGP